MITRIDDDDDDDDNNNNNNKNNNNNNNCNNYSHLEVCNWGLLDNTTNMLLITVCLSIGSAVTPIRTRDIMMTLWQPVSSRCSGRCQCVHASDCASGRWWEVVVIGRCTNRHTWPIGEYTGYLVLGITLYTLLSIYGSTILIRLRGPLS